MSSTLQELASERAAARDAIASLNLTPVLFELGARPHPPRELYRSYLEQSQVFVGIYWQSYGWIAPGAELSGLEDEYVLSAGKPRLVYVKTPAEREEELERFLGRLRDESSVSYKHFETTEELARLLRDDLAVLLAERFATGQQELPSGTVTMLFTDIEGSTRLLRALGSGYRTALEDHSRLLREIWRRHEGREIGVEGDSFFVVFARAKEAVAAAVEAQQALVAHRWPEGGSVRVRMGIHTGEPDLDGTNYVGLGVHRAARIAAAGHGGQVLLSEATRHVLEGDELPGVTTVDLGLRRLSDFEEPQRLWQLVIEGLRSEFPPLRTLDSEPPRMQGLPAARTSLVGREAALARVEAALTSGEVRLLTLTGPGGIGKTRLAVEAARRLSAHYADGVAFVPLESIDSARLVTPAIASALELREVGGDLLPGIVSYLEDKALLLVLDNFEHVVEAASVVSTLLDGAPKLSVLVTSRQLLRLRDEQELAVSPLEPETEATLLFADRAAAVNSAFELGASDLEVVSEICRRLDGVPLAIELAAPRMRLLTPRQLLDRLSERLALAGPRDAPARQRTLDAAIAWSYELLGPAERKAFARFGVFRGSFSLEAAEAVCGVPGDEFLDVLASLLDKSMVYRLPTSAGSRFAMLSLIREYAFARLADSEDREEAYEQFVDHFVDFAAHVERDAGSLVWSDWRAAIDQDADNLRAVLERLVEQGRGEKISVLVRGIWPWFWFRGYIEEGCTWTRQALERGPLGPSDQGWMLALDGLFTFFEADFPAAAERLGQAAGLFRQTGDLRGLALTRVVGSLVTAAVEGKERALSEIALGLAGFEEIGDRWGVAAALSGMCRIHSIFGDFEDTEELLERCLVAAEEVEDDLLVVLALANHAYYHLSLGDAEASRAIIARAFAVIRATGVRYGAEDLIEALALLEANDGAPVRAAELVGAADGLRETLRTPLWGLLLERHEQLVGELREAVGDAVFEAALERGRAYPLSHWLTTLAEAPLLAR